MIPKTNPWAHAKEAERDYITPEDIGDAIENLAQGDDEVAHSQLDDLWETVLAAIGQKRAEDPSLCAFVAVKGLLKVPTRWYA